MLLFDVKDAVRPLCSSILQDLSPESAQVGQNPYKQMQKEMQAVPVGSNGGVGAVMGYKVLSWSVW